MEHSTPQTSVADSNPAPPPSLAKAMVSGVGLMVAGGAISRLFSVVSAPILTRLVGPSPYGIIALVGTVSSLATTVALMGIDLSYARVFFSNGGKGASAVEGFCWRLAMALGLIASMAAGLAWWFLIPSASAHRHLALVTALTTLVAILSTMALTRQRIRSAYPRIVASTILGTAAGIVLSILLAWTWRPDAWAMLCGTLAGSIVTLAILGLPEARLLLSRPRLDPGQRRDILSLGASSIVTTAMLWTISSMDRWMLGAWCGTVSVGVYAFAASLGLSGMMVNNAVSLAWFPEVTREFESGQATAQANIARLWARMAGLHMLTWLTITALGGDVIRLLADPRFHGGTRFIPALAGGVFFYGIAGLANTGPFLKKDLKPTAWWWVVGAVFNVGCNALLIRAWGPMGAALTACLSFALIALGMLWSAQSRLHLPLPWKALGAATALALLAGLLMQRPWGRHPFSSLLLKLPAGLLITAALGQVLAPDWMLRALRRP